MDLVGTALNAGSSSGMLSQLSTNTQCLSPEQAAKKGRHPSRNGPSST
jgi:hypothetical protein